ncbi:MAG: hypothetical protein PHE24_04605 [Patescibacteria group bacterium]|nr:hypothetical protein [Patescibacteria group bacterium]
MLYSKTVLDPQNEKNNIELIVTIHIVTIAVVMLMVYLRKKYNKKLMGRLIKNPAIAHSVMLFFVLFLVVSPISTPRLRCIEINIILNITPSGTANTNDNAALFNE